VGAEYEEVDLSDGRESGEHVHEALSVPVHRGPWVQFGHRQDSHGDDGTGRPANGTSPTGAHRRTGRGGHPR
jgi:hypothetical protein